MAQRLVQRLHLLRVSALLRAENRRCTVGAAQRVVDVRRDFELHLGQARVQVTGVDPRQLRQCQAALFQRLPVGIQQA